MKIRFIKPKLEDYGNPQDGDQGINPQSIANCELHIEDLVAYLRGVIISLALSIAFTLFIAIAYKWYLLFIGLPLVRYCFYSYNLTRFELKIHIVMNQISREMLIEKLTGAQGDLTKRIFGELP